MRDGAPETRETRINEMRNQRGGNETGERLERNSKQIK